MQKKLYVGGLAWATDNAGLEQAFSAYGEVEEAKVIMDRETGRSRGFGFVTFVEQSDAEKALALDGTQLDGRTIKVSIAQERQPRTGGGGGGGGGGRRW